MKISDKYFVNRQIKLSELAQYFYENKKSAQDLLNYERNADYIFSKYSDVEKKQYGSANANFVKVGTLLDLPREDRVFILEFQRYGITPTNINEMDAPYLSGEVKQFLSSKLNVIEYGEENPQLYVKRFNKVYVKIFSRALNKVIYLTPFLENASVQVANLGGSFNMVLQGIPYIENSQGEIEMNVSKFGEEFLSKYTYSRDSQPKIFFEKVLNPQDLIFIKLEEPFLSGEEEYINVDTVDNYDMIGLVDKVLPMKNFDNEKISISVSIQGRDLIKIFVEDGTHYFPYQFYVTANKEEGDEIKAKDNFFVGGNRISDKYATRIFGSLNEVELLGNKTIRQIMNFVTSKLKVMTLNLGNFGNSSAFSEGIEEQGIWNFIEIDLEPNVANRVLFDSSILTMQGSILNFIKKILQEPFVEILSDTIGNKFRFIVRTPPTLKETYKNNPTLVISKKYLVSDQTGISDETVYSWFYLRPTAMYFGDQTLAAIQNRAIGFEKLLDIYGSKKLDLEHTYTYYTTNDPYKKEDKDNSKVQNIEDLVWMVKSFGMEQFLKKGTLTFTNIAGIKKGMNIYIPEDDMLYYIESYSHNFTLTNRTTSVNVTRGLKLSEIDTYYDLIKIEYDETKVIDAYLDLEIFNRLFNKVYI